MTRISTTLAMAAAALLASTAGAQSIVSAVSATVDIGGPGFGSIADTHNQAGLLSTYTPGEDFDAYFATNPLHSTQFSPGEFFGDLGAETLRVTYDLGGEFIVDALALWNEESSGIDYLNVFWSLDAITFRPLALELRPTDHFLADYPADIFGFAATRLRYVKLQGNGCPQPNVGSFDACAIGEVAFRGLAVPEPTTWAMMLGGFAMVGFAARRRTRGAVTA